MRAHAVAVFNGKLLLLLSDSNPNQGSPNSWNLIGGHAEDDETPVQTLLREFEEEACVVPSDYVFLAELPEADTNLFLVKLSEEEARQVCVGNEGVELRFFSLDQLKDLPIYLRMRNEFPAYVSLITQYLR